MLPEQTAVHRSVHANRLCHELALGLVIGRSLRRALSDDGEDPYFAVKSTLLLIVVSRPGNRGENHNLGYVALVLARAVGGGGARFA